MAFRLIKSEHKRVKTMKVSQCLKTFFEFSRAEHAIFIIVVVIATLLDLQPASKYYEYRTMILQAFQNTVRLEINFFLLDVIINAFGLVIYYIPFILPPFFISLYAFCLNDIVDYRTDKANNRIDRPLVLGKLSLDEAKMITNLLGTLCIISILLAASAAETRSDIIAVFTLWGFFLASILYSFYIKDLPFLGNTYIAFTMAIPFIYPILIVHENGAQVPNTLLILAISAFVMGMAREIVKSAQDIYGDLKFRASKTLPVIMGERNSVILAGILLILLGASCFFYLLTYHNTLPHEKLLEEEYYIFKEISVFLSRSNVSEVGESLIKTRYANAIASLVLLSFIAFSSLYLGLDCIINHQRTNEKNAWYKSFRKRSIYAIGLIIGIYLLFTVLIKGYLFR